MRLKRICPGSYLVLGHKDAVKIEGFYVSSADAGGYGAGMRWVIYFEGGHSSDPYETLSDARATLQDQTNGC